MESLGSPEVSGLSALYSRPRGHQKERGTDAMFIRLFSVEWGQSWVIGVCLQDLWRASSG